MVQGYRPDLGKRDRGEWHICSGQETLGKYFQHLAIIWSERRSHACCPDFGLGLPGIYLVPFAEPRNRG